MTDAKTIAVIATFVFLLAGIIKGTVGIGMPTVSVGVLSQIIPPHTAIALVVFPLLASNLWQVIRTGAGLATLRRYGLLVGCLVVSLWATTFLTARVPADLLLGIISAAMLIFSVTSLLGTQIMIADRHDGPAQAITGLAAGVLGGLTSIWALPLVTYLMGRKADSDEFVRAVGLFLLIGSVPLMLWFWQTGLLNGQTAPLSLAMIVPTILGFSVGEVIRRRLDAQAFKKVLLWFFLLMGLNLLRRALF